jgi:hypothetical protein
MNIASSMDNTQILGTDIMGGGSEAQTSEVEKLCAFRFEILFSRGG